jgi:prevent-host-death family protein
MDTFTVRDLQERPGAIIREAEQGHLSLITKRGHPVFLAVPFQETLLEMGLHKILALQLLQQGHFTLRQAAKLALVSIEEMMPLATNFGINLVDYPKEELEEELKLV